MTFRLISILAICLLLLPSAHSQEDTAIAAKNAKTPDVRILIDISGSMKKNDPKNLRIPALKLITQLMPNGAQSGVWTFGQWVNMLVPRGAVDVAWKDKAYAAANQINSNGQFTNIEKVLQDATWDWNKPDDTKDRSVIFLTDGVVDISKDQNENAAARKRILETRLSKLRDAKVAVHTIALSDEADKAFLRQLSAATGGFYEQADTAEKLERIFLKMFEKSVPVESLPLKDNAILVDESIKELTLLVFRQAGNRDVSVIMPEGTSFDVRKHPDNVAWRREERYDLITVQNPIPGRWKIDADLDPDNRVMVVTDLNVRASRLPNLMMAGDQMPYFVELHEKNSVITRPEFLDFVTIVLNREAPGISGKSVLTDDGQSIDRKKGDGRFSTVIGKDVVPAHYEYELVVNGTTFKRSKRYSMQVVENPVAVNVMEVSSGNPAHYVLTITPYAELVKPNSLLIDATVSKEGANSASISIPRSGPSEWRLDMDIKEGDIYYVDLNLQAERLNGKQVTKELGRFTMGAGNQDDYQSPDVPPKTPPAAVESESAQSEAEIIDDAHPDEVPPADETPDTGEETMTSEEQPVEEEAPNWMMVAAKVVGLNLFLIVGGYFAYRKWFRAPPEDDDVEEEVADK